MDQTALEARIDQMKSTARVLWLFVLICILIAILASRTSILICQISYFTAYVLIAISILYTIGHYLFRAQRYFLQILHHLESIDRHLARLAEKEGRNPQD